VPLRVFSGDMSQPVTVAIRSGGGPCVDPPEQGYGQITWQKAENIAASGAVTAAESVTVSLQESPGKQTPAPPALALTVATAVYHGPSCPIPGFRSLDAGTVTAQAAGAALLDPWTGRLGALPVRPGSLPQLHSRSCETDQSREIRRRVCAQLLPGSLHLYPPDEGFSGRGSRFGKFDLRPTSSGCRGWQQLRMGYQRPDFPHHPESQCDHADHQVAGLLHLPP